MNFVNTTITGCYILEQDIHADKRGAFVKMFRKSLFEQHNLEYNFTEQYYSESKQNVIRGMHFQKPPADHAKLVTVIQGTILDVILDIRKGSPSYGKYEAFELSRSNGKSIYIPRGCAHGFCALSDFATAFYMVSSEYSPENDCGISYDSFGFTWPTTQPIVSGRDTTFPSFQDFTSPF